MRLLSGSDFGWTEPFLILAFGCGKSNNFENKKETEDSVSRFSRPEGLIQKNSNVICGGFYILF
jgi:hypothetical protein